MTDTPRPANDSAPEKTIATVVAEDAASPATGTVGGTIPLSKPPPPAPPKRADAGFTTLNAGMVLGKCKIERELGRGGMGAVYLAQHQTLDVPVAVKILPPEIAARDPQFAERFMREAKLACRIRHANVISVMDAEKDEKSGLYYIVQEFVDGGTVRDLMRKGPLTEAQALDIATGAAEALAAAADFGIVHRDIKPENIMLTRKGVVKLADLGIAKEMSDDAGLTMSKVMMGTPSYMAPEQAHDAKSVDARADIYSLGATLYHMLCGAPPYSGDTAYAVLSNLATAPVPNPQAKCPALSAATANLIQRMMDKKPENRPSSAQELLTELHALRNPAAAATDLQKMAQDLISEMRAMRATPNGTMIAGKTATGISGQPARINLAIKIAAALFAVLLAAGLLKVMMDRQPPPTTPTNVVVDKTPDIPVKVTTTTDVTTSDGTVVEPVKTPATPVVDAVAARAAVDALLVKALDAQALADPDVRTLFADPVRFVSASTNRVEPALVVKELVAQRVQIKDLFAILGKPRVGIDITETVVGKDGIAARDSKIDRFRTAVKNEMEKKYGLFVVDVTGDRAEQKAQCDILITGNVETTYFSEAVPPALAELGGTTPVIGYNTAVKVRFLNAITNQDLDSSVTDFEPKGAEKYCGLSNGEAIKNSIKGAIETLLPEWMQRVETAWVDLRVQAATTPPAPAP